MRILIISDITSYCRGGAPAETRLLINGLIERGHAVALASDVPLAGVRDARHYTVTVPTGSALVEQIDAALKEFRPDFVHVMHMGGLGLIRISRILNDYRWACTVHAVTPLERKLRGFHAHETLHYLFRALVFSGSTFLWRRIYQRRVMPVSIVHNEEFKRLLLSKGAAVGSVRLIPLPFAPARYNQSKQVDALRRPRSPLLITVGGIAHTKGQHDAIEALPALIRRFPLLRYRIIGEVRDPSYLRYLRGLIRRLDLSSCVTMSTDLNDAEVQQALEDADLYIQPSHEEGFCLAYAEAAAVVPRLVGTLTGAIAEISADDPGARVVPVRSPEALVAAVTELLDTELPDTLLDQRARRLGERFSIARYLRAHEDLYQRGGLGLPDGTI